MILYRFQEILWSERSVSLVKQEHPVIKETPCGAWIDYYGSRKFVRLDAKKQFAHKTEKEAFESFQARKRRQVSILKTKLAIAEAALRLTPEDTRASYFDLTGM